MVRKLDANASCFLVQCIYIIYITYESTRSALIILFLKLGNYQPFNMAIKDELNQIPHTHKFDYVAICKLESSTSSTWRYRKISPGNI